MIVTIDVSCEESDPVIGLAQELTLDSFLLSLPGVELIVSHEQLESIYMQARGWFVEEE